MSGTQVRPGGDRELRVHDGIIGAIILASVAVGMTVDPVWFWLAAAQG